MDQIYGEKKPEAPPNFFAKRRPGRPRKDLSQGAKHRVSGRVRPRFNERNRTKSLPLDAIEDSYNSVLGQPVTGVVESSFDAGYVLSVRIGNSATNLRGVVFKPGHYVPISAENDVAPHVQMIRRSEISLPLMNQAHSRGRHPRSRGRNARHVPVPQLSTFIDPSMGSGGNVVSSLLQPVNSSNGMAFPSQEPQVSHSGGQYADPRYVQVQPGIRNLQPSINLSDTDVFYQVGEKVNSANLVKASSAPRAAKNDGSDDVEEQLDAMPLKTMHTYVHNQQSHPVHKPLQIQRVGKMTELLQAVQENMPGNPLLRAANFIPRNDLPRI